MKKTYLHNWWNFLPLSLFMLTLVSCTEVEPVPKPRGWPRITLPAHEWQTFENPNCPFTFEFPKAAVIATSLADSCLTDFFFKDWNCKWHLTYYNVAGNPAARMEQMEEYRKLVYKHTQKVTQIQETPLQTEMGTGIMYELYGAVGVPAQFIFGDSSNLIMTSFYFSHALDNDSLSPVIDWVKEDMKHMVETIKWK